MEHKTFQVQYTVRMKQSAYPSNLVEDILRKWSNKTGISLQNPDDFILKSVGQEDYLYGNHQLIHFKVTRQPSIHSF